MAQKAQRYPSVQEGEVEQNLLCFGSMRKL